MKYVYQYCNVCRKETSQVLTNISSVISYRCSCGPHEGTYRPQEPDKIEKEITFKRLG